MNEHPRDASDTPEDPADVGELRPDEAEPLGPLEGLIHATAVELVDKVGNDPEIAMEAEKQAIEDDLGVQEEGVEVSELFGMMLAVVLSIATLIFALYYLFFVTRRDNARNLAEDVPDSRYIERRELRAEAQNAYGHYAVNPGAEGRYRIPIDAAMKIVERNATGVIAAPASRSLFNVAGLTLRPAAATQSANADSPPVEIVSTIQDSTRVGVPETPPAPMEEPYGENAQPPVPTVEGH